jgi:hypothetical protein
MLRVTVKAQTSATPEQVLAIAGTDFSAARATVWPNVTTRKLNVHERGASFAEVTEGATGIARWFWERSRYDWSEPGTVKQTVLDSNVLEPGSRWALRVAPADGGGSQVEMTVERSFRRTFAGRIGHALNRAGGKQGFGWFLHKALKAVERTVDRNAQPETANAAAS